MKRLFLSSQIDIVAQHISQKVAPQLSGKRTAFISTAAEPMNGDKAWLPRNMQGLIDCGLDVFDYTITDKSYEQIKQDLGDIDVLHVNGGDYFYLLLQAKKSGFDRFVREYVASGKIYIGSSAGSIVTSTETEIARTPGKDEYAQYLEDFKGFGLVDFIIFPHWGAENKHTERRKQRVMNAFKEEHKIILLNDYQYVQVEDEMYRIVDVRDR